MWTKTLKVKFKGESLPVQVWLNDDTGQKQVVRVQSIMNEYFLIEDIAFGSRDAAYDFIKHYPVAMAKAFVVRVAYENGAVE